MDNQSKPQSAGAPFGAGGGAVDDLTPPTMKGSMQTIPMAPPPGAHAPASENKDAPKPPAADEMDRWDPLESTCRHASLSIL